MPRSPIPRDAVGLGSAAAAAAVLIALYGGYFARAQESRPATTAGAAAMPRPVVSTHDLMELFNQPVYEFLKKSIAEQPAGDDAWQQVAHRGLQVAEVANLVALRDDYASHDNWRPLAGDLQAAGERLAQAADNRDWQAVQQAYHGVIQQCNACHQTVAPEAAPEIKP